MSQNKINLSVYKGTSLSQLRDESTKMSDPSKGVAADLATMFLALGRIQAVVSSSSAPVGVLGDAALFALGDLMDDDSEVDALRFATFVNKCKEMLAY